MTRRAVTLLLALALAVPVAATGPGPASARVPQTDFSTCTGSGTPQAVGPAPHTDVDPSLPWDAVIEVPTTQPLAGYYQQVPVQVGSQVFDLTLDTGSSWLVINADAVADNPRIVPTGETAAVTYGGGSACASGPVVTGPVSIGGRAPRTVTFLLAQDGSFPFAGILGVNTWQPVASALDVPMRALGIDTYQISVPADSDPAATGSWVINAQPDIDRADPRRVATFTQRALAGDNRVYVPGTVTASGSATGPVMLDIGTPENIVTVFPRAAREMGYDAAAGTWADPSVRVRVTVAPGNGRPFVLSPTPSPARADDLIVLTSTQVADPYSGVTGLAGTDAIVGVDYVRPWILGVRFTADGSVIRLLARDRTAAVVRGCGVGVGVERIRSRGLSRLLPGTCRVNGSPVTVRVTARPAPGSSCTTRACLDDAYDLLRRPNGSVWVRTFGVPVRLAVTWTAPPYLAHNGLRVARVLVVR